MQTKQKQRVTETGSSRTKRRRAAQRGRRRKPVKAGGLREQPKQVAVAFHAMKISDFYRPLKKPVTLRLDADVLAWFKKQGRGYQTRINRTLRRVMMEARKGSGE